MWYIETVIGVYLNVMNVLKLLAEYVKYESIIP